MLCAPGSLSSQQATPTQKTIKTVKQFLDYAASNPDAVVNQKTSDMLLAVHRDESYLSKTKARSRSGGHFFCSANEIYPANNGAILTVSQIIKSVITSAAESELGEI